MKKVFIDTGAENSGHNIRGIGVHTRELVEHLRQLGDKEVEILSGDAGSYDLSMVDLTHLTSFHPHFLTLPKKKLSAKVLVTIHDLIPLIYPEHYPPGLKGMFRYFAQKMRLKSVDGIITISETSKKDICRFLKVSPSMVSVVHLASKNLFKPMKHGEWEKDIQQKYNLPNKFVLYVGDVNYNKNIPTLVEACKLAGIKLVMVGKNPTKIEEFAASGHPEHTHLKGVSFEGVVRPGFVSDEDLGKIYNLATLYCQPSFYEGFGLPVLEAISAGCAVVASRIQAHVEIAGDGVLYANPHSANDMAQMIGEVAKDKNLQESLVKKGQKILESYTWENTAKGTLSVYKKILSS